MKKLYVIALLCITFSITGCGNSNDSNKVADNAVEEKITAKEVSDDEKSFSINVLKEEATKYYEDTLTFPESDTDYRVLDIGNSIIDAAVTTTDSSGNDVRVRVSYSCDDDSYTTHFVEINAKIYCDDGTLD